MTSHGKLRKERVGLVDYDTQIKGKIITSIAVMFILALFNMLFFVGKQKLQGTKKKRILTSGNTFRMSCILTCTLSSPFMFGPLSEVRCQLGDQLKVLDLTLEQKSQQLQDMTDYLRRRGEIESEYARSLEKLAERFTSRIKR